MTRPRGGYIGFNGVPAASALNSAASGIWTLREAEALKRAGTWPSAFVSPASLSGLQLWLDASDSSTLYDATTGGSLVAADGGVARWEDKSGNGRHATQATSANRPARKTAIQGGLDVLRFDGSNDFLDGSSTPTTGDTRTVFIVSKSATTAGGEIIQIGKWASNSTRAFLCRQIFISPNTTIGGDLIAVNLRVNDVQLTLTNFHLSTWSQVASTRAVSYWHDQQSQTVTGTVQAFASTAAGYVIGKANSGGTDFGFHQCDIAEIIIYDSALSDADRELVENYLLAKWGIT